MKRHLTLAVLLPAVLLCNSCGLLRSAIQMPARTVKSVGRTLGVSNEYGKKDLPVALRHAETTEKSETTE